MSRNHRGRILGEPVTRSLPAPAGGVQLETFVPWTLVKRGSKKEVVTPLDTPEEFVVEARIEQRARSTTQDTSLMRALGLAHYWQRLLDEQRFSSVAEIAEAEGIDVSRAYRLLRLTLFAPEIIEQLIAVSGTALEPMMRRSWPTEWRAQVEAVNSTQ
ncbi:bacteriophage-like protein [Ralstonia solanacearum]|nr:bacteriophage-like protein [Ralstonia solanacearum]